MIKEIIIPLIYNYTKIEILMSFLKTLKFIEKHQKVIKIILFIFTIMTIVSSDLFIMNNFYTRKELGNISLQLSVISLSMTCILCIISETFKSKIGIKIDNLLFVITIILFINGCILIF